MAMYTEWHFPYWGKGKGSHIGIVARAWVSSARDPGFQSPLGTSINYIQIKNLKTKHKPTWNKPLNNKININLHGIN